MDASISRGLNDKIYDRRKAAALELEKLVLSSDITRISAIIDQLCGMFSSSNSALHARNGGLIGLAATAIALGQDVAPFLGTIITPVLACFQDPESRVRYHACESLYNIAKVSKGEILVHFNEIFDALSKLSADSEMSVKNGAELLDRLMKDIVAEAAPTYISIYPGNTNPNLPPPRHMFDTEPPRPVPPLSSIPTSNRLASLNLDNVSPSTSVEIKKGSPIRSDNAMQEKQDEAAIAAAAAEDKRAFNLARFIPLLSERVYVISPYTRMHLVSWIMVLDSIPDLELVAWLPDFLDGLLKYLADGNIDVRLATENVLSEFLREIKCIAEVQEKQAEIDRRRRESRAVLRKRSSRQTMQSGAERDDTIQEDQSGENENREDGADGFDDSATMEDQEWEGEGSGLWQPGQGVFIDHAAIMDIIIQHLSYPDELVQSTAMEWILTFLELAQNTVVAFTPRIVPAILPNLASQHRHIKLAAHETNSSLYRVIQSLPLQVQPSQHPPSLPSTTALVPPLTAGIAKEHHQTASSPPTALPAPLRKDFALPDAAQSQSDTIRATPSSIQDPLDSSSVTASASTISNLNSNSAPRTSTLPSSGSMTSNSVLPAIKTKLPSSSEPVTPMITDFPQGSKGRLSGRPDSPGQAQIANGTSASAEKQQQQQQQQQQQPMSPIADTIITVDDDPFDVRETVNVLTLQFLSDHAETRIAALEWLLMLHLKAPNKILSRDSGTFPALLKTLSDPSEDVVKHDLQLLAQISASSEEAYFTSFMSNVLELFSTDRRLLETRGSLIIRQLCLHLNAERIFRSIAEILEKDDDLEFASMMVVKLNMILITSPELADFRRRLKNLESKDGQMLFSSLYRSWCHNAVAVFALCLLAQAYEHASTLLQIFAELELTVSLLVQIDKLVMLIESPVFTNLRLQLLEPDKYPYLPKCLYGLLMILPQSSAFVSLRARLSVVHSSGYVPIQPKPSATGSSFIPTSGSTRSKLGGKDEIKWQELLSHFRSVQSRHEKARRQQHSAEANSISSLHYSSPSQIYNSAPNTAGTAPKNSSSSTLKKKPASRSSVDGNATVGRLSGMSPLNPRRTGPSGSGSGGGAIGVSIGGAVASMNVNASSLNQGQGQGRPMSPPGGKGRKILGGMRRREG